MEVDFQPETKQITSSEILNYRMWQQSRVKWPLYLKNKHNPNEKCINIWDKLIIKQLLDGPTIAWDCGGLYFDGLIDDLYVAETRTCPNWISNKINIVDNPVTGFSYSNPLIGTYYYRNNYFFNIWFMKCASRRIIIIMMFC